MKISRLYFLILVLLTFSTVDAQELVLKGAISDLEGAIDVEDGQDYNIQFTGGSGMRKDLEGTPIGEKITEKNSIYLLKKMSYSGILRYSINYDMPTLQLAILKFSSKESDIIPIKEMKIAYVQTTPSNSFSNIDSITSQLKAKKGETFLFIINNIKKSYDDISVTFKTSDIDTLELIKQNTKIIDDRLPNDATSINIQLKDQKTKLPIIGNINVKTKKKSTLYAASEVILGSDIQQKASVECSAEGYFFKDVEFDFRNVKDTSVIIELKPVQIGENFKIESLEFLRGTATLLSRSEMSLKRIKNFLALNSNIRIEIQGYVNQDGKENNRANKLSKERAKAVMKYFQKSGISRSRMTYKGFGNSNPIYPDPKNKDEEQANRRVEIKILK